MMIPEPLPGMEAPETPTPRIYRKNGLPAHDLHKYDRDTAWIERALCVGTPIIWWAPPFATRQDSQFSRAWAPDPQAYALCEACPVKADCLHDANRSGDIDWSMRAGQGPRAYQRRQEKSARERLNRAKAKKERPPPPGGSVAVLKNFKRRDAT